MKRGEKEKGGERCEEGMEREVIIRERGRGEGEGRKRGGRRNREGKESGGLLIGMERGKRGSTW